MTTASLEGTAKAIGETIRDARIAKDLTKAEAARRAGVSRRTWHEVEEGLRTTSTAETLNQFEQILDLPEGYLFAMTAKSANQHIEGLRQRALDIVRTMSGDELQVFVDSNGGQSIRAMLEELSTQLRELRGEESTTPSRRRGS